MSDKENSRFVPQSELEKQREYALKVKEILESSYPRDYVPYAFIHSYGCQQNVSDGEKIKGVLSQMGYKMTDCPDNADFVMYNTCAVREHAEQRVFGNVGALKNIKRRRPNMLIGLCGCMTQQESVADKLKKSFPFVDIVLGTNMMHKLPEIIYQKLTEGKRIFDLSGVDGLIAEGIPALRDGSSKAWVPVMYGCNNFCSYCIVPYVRGRERSRKSSDIIAEVRELVAQGYKEVTLLGQNVNSYGKENGEINFPQLLCKLNEIDGDFRIRFMTSHPKDATRELIDAIASCQKVCKHLHLPVQSGSDRILKEMNRKYTAADYLEIIKYAREKMPELSFTSDIIVGFPNESEEDFEATLELIKKVEYDLLYTFIYSKRPGTPAAEMYDPISDERKSDRFRRLLSVQEKIAYTKLSDMKGKTFKVLCEGEGRILENSLCGRADNNIMVEFENKGEVKEGEFVNVKITSSKGYVCIGEIV
ncbi:MAG: tRNA (N6-isopentenyl adenosine(37)-C2)-methylthiotransferase MiaB [Oscillospiraceae bacterium]|nr:tRNA (N6-isopentenyl adenosine(37)-C2)-methylthiotransferase MiaB [Oscillospiraceae bacterium]